MFKHTKGYWSYKDGVVFTSEGKQICVVNQDRQAASSNGELLAAGPEAFEVLHDCMWMIESFEGRDIETERLIDKARNLYKRMKGN